MKSFISISDENDYILSANTYSPYNGEEEVSHREPKEILREIEELDQELDESRAEIRQKLSKELHFYRSVLYF